MKPYLFFAFAALVLIAQPALASYPCPAGPGPGEQQIGVGGGSHGIAAVPLCVQTGRQAGSGGGGAAGGGYAGYRCVGCNIFTDPSSPPSEEAIRTAIENERQMARTLEIQKKMLEHEAKEKEYLAKEIKQLEANPAYQRYMRGEWQIFQSKKDSPPGDNCVATWRKKGGSVSIIGPGKAYQGGMLIFWSADIPRPSTTQTVAVTLKQSKYQAQSVNALNFSVPNIQAGAIGLTVPNIDAALNTMLDVEHFIVEMDGRVVADIDWTGGLAARTKLKQCVSKS
ncbi:hypothetical protein [Chitinimonas taiwanensis]|uniref:hypothetical protein n=1 Tax=Chitinimonas taiwanensis TaxID=240412 RepID=UPI0035B01796